MKKEKVGIVIIATNMYYILGIRFIKRFLHFYKGDSNISFYFFSDRDPLECLSEEECKSVIWNVENHNDWVSATNSKFENMLKCISDDKDYLFYFDADTNIDKDFGDWFLIGDLVGGEHFGNRSFLKGGKPDTKLGVMSFTPEHSPLKHTYYYGAFFGGKTLAVKLMCTMLKNWQLTDRMIKYEPPVNDETYINKYFHFCPPETVACEEFKFLISDKAGFLNTRNPRWINEHILDQMKVLKNKVYDIQNGKIKL